METESGNLTAHLDIFPTLCELADAKIPTGLNEQLEGFSLVPLLTNDSVEEWKKRKDFISSCCKVASGYAEIHKYTMAGVRMI